MSAGFVSRSSASRRVMSRRVVGSSHTLASRVSAERSAVGDWNQAIPDQKREVVIVGVLAPSEQRSGQFRPLPDRKTLQSGGKHQPN